MPPLVSGEVVELFEGRPVFETPELRSRANRRCPETLLWEASDEARTRADLLLRLARGPAREIWPISFLLLFFYLKGRDLTFD
jgi:hypothetical protein